MKKAITLFLLVLSFTSSYGHDRMSKAEKAMWREAVYKEDLTKALLSPLKAKYVYIHNYTDSVFPNADIMKLKNIEQIVVCGKDTLKKKPEGNPNVPIAVRIDTAKLKQLPKLKYLTLAYFDFKKFPVEICHLTKLKGLDLSACFIDSLPNEIENLKNLQVLMLRLNNLSQLPYHIKYLKKLELFDVTNNSFTEFPKVFCVMKKVKRINLSNVDDEKGEPEHSPSWPYQAHVNNIDYVAEVESLKEVLMNRRFNQIFVHIPSEAVQDRIWEKMYSKKMYLKIEWQVTPEDEEGGKGEN